MNAQATASSRASASSSPSAHGAFTKTPELKLRELQKVEDKIIDLFEIAARVTALLSKIDVTRGSNQTTLSELCMRYIATVKEVHQILREVISCTTNYIPSSNSSYEEKHDLQIAMMKCAHVTSQLKGLLTSPGHANAQAQCPLYSRVQSRSDNHPFKQEQRTTASSPSSSTASASLSSTGPSPLGSAPSVKDTDVAAVTQKL
eukprot:TRINITY_DN5974_c0_g1_i2.p2 TRINITY_DN5974_c0_g1~~TRINITY_DN5974_c0_g1_i2.p2  ORF type:complete len:203 (-),score=51.47 TRINITY_DN5974_c0_g1_i2:1284-1892(-)